MKIFFSHIRFKILLSLSEFKDENMMDAYNIAICLAPTLIPVPEDKKDQVNHQTDTIELIKLIIQHNDEIFNMECDGPVYEKFDRFPIEFLLLLLLLKKIETN